MYFSHDKKQGPIIITHFDLLWHTEYRQITGIFIHFDTI